MKRVALLAATALSALWLVPQTGSFAEPPTRPACHDGLDNDGDGAVDLDDTGCANANDATESDEPAPPPPACSDSVDNDGDGAFDLDDSGCSSADDATEAEEPPAHCADGIDNDGDGATDYPADGDCSSPTDASEEPAASCRTVDSVEACMDVVPGALVGSFGQAAPGTVLTNVAGYVHVYAFTLPNGAVVKVPCVVLGTGSHASNPCADAGGVFDRRVVTLVNHNFDTPDSALTVPLATVEVCAADLVMTVNDVGVSSYPGYAVC